MRYRDLQRYDRQKRSGGIGAVASVVASCMANLGILYLIGFGNPARCLILLFDGLTMQLVSVGIKRNHECPVCAAKASGDKKRQKSKKSIQFR